MIFFLLSIFPLPDLEMIGSISTRIGDFSNFLALRESTGPDISFSFSGVFFWGIFHPFNGVILCMFFGNVGSNSCQTRKRFPTFRTIIIFNVNIFIVVRMFFP